MTVVEGLYSGLGDHGQAAAAAAAQRNAVCHTLASSPDSDLDLTLDSSACNVDRMSLFTLTTVRDGSSELQSQVDMKMAMLVEAPAAVEDALASLLDHQDGVLQVTHRDRRGERFCCRLAHGSGIRT